MNDQKNNMLTNAGIEKPTIKEVMFANITEDMLRLYHSKNSDYGDSFGKSYTDFGVMAGVIRMSDKMNRLKQLSKKPDCALVKDESMQDTLRDLANYAIMTLIEIALTPVPDVFSKSEESE